MKTHADIMPIARLFFLGDESIYPGWYLQHYQRSKLLTTRLEISRQADVYEAVAEAAGFVGCVPDQIQVEGAPWPHHQSTV